MNKYIVHTQQAAAIVQEFEIEAKSELQAHKIIKAMIASGDLPSPIYAATETCGGLEVFEISKL